MLSAVSAEMLPTSLPFVCQSSTVKPTSRLVQQAQGPSASWRKRLRYVKSSGALLTLLWNFAYFSVVNLELKGITDSASSTYYRYVLFVFLFLYAVPAMAADVYLGRYRVMVWGTTVTWLTLIAVCVGAALIKSNLFVSDWFVLLLQFIWFVGMNFGRALFQSNVVQFGIDQLPSASSDELSSFIHWFLFSEVFGQAAGFLLSYFLMSLVWESFVLIIVFSLLLVLFHFCSITWFNKEPPDKSAYRNVYQVLKYAWKHTVPERRAYLYWSETPPSRIDLGKCKNGGPFTNQQVEDVKTLMRLFAVFLAVVFVLQGVEGEVIMYGVYKMFPHLGLSESSILTKMSQYNQIIAVVTMLYVLCHELIAIPLFRNYTPSILHKLWISSLCYFLSSISYLFIDSFGHLVTGPHNNITCFFHDEDLAGPGHILDVSPYYVLIPSILTALGYVNVYIGALEFATAQSPLNAVGLSMGLFYSFIGGGFLLSLCIVLPIYYKYPLTTDQHQLSCGSAYFLVCTTIGLAGMVIFTVMVLRYKYRERENVVTSNSK